MPETRLRTELASPNCKAAAGEHSLDDVDMALIVIGQRWLALREPGEQRLIDLPNDSVRITVEQVLSRRLPLVPVLVQGATLPSAAELPETLAVLADFHPIDLHHARWRDDLELLVERIETTLAATMSGVHAEGRGASVQARSRLLEVRFRTARALEVFRRKLVPRSRDWRVIRLVLVVVAVVAILGAIYGMFSYVRRADLRAIERLSPQLKIMVPLRTASTAIDNLKGIARRSKNPAVINAAVAKLKVLVTGDQRNTFDAWNIRRQAIEAIKLLRANDLTQDFAAGELNRVELFDADLSGAVMRDMSLQSASVQGVKFVGADLTGADLTGVWVRGADFSGATLKGADLSDMDWFNAKGLSAAQLQSAVVGTISPCPRDGSSLHSLPAFRAQLDKEYDPPWSKRSDEVRRFLQDIWESYSQPGGLCDTLDKWQIAR